MKITVNIREAIARACKAKKGGANAFCKECGVVPPQISRYLSGKIKEMKDSSYERLYPYIKDFLDDDTSIITSGNIVTLKSGGPLMVAEQCSLSTASCVWFVDTKLYREDFPINCLRCADRNK